MRLGIFAKTFAGADPAAVLGAAKAAGYAAVHYNMASVSYTHLTLPTTSRV